MRENTSTRKYTRIIVVVAYSMSLFLMKLNFHKQSVIFISLNKKFLKDKESPLNIALLFILSL